MTKFYEILVKKISNLRTTYLTDWYCDYKKHLMEYALAGIYRPSRKTIRSNSINISSNINWI